MDSPEKVQAVALAFAVLLLALNLATAILLVLIPAKIEQLEYRLSKLERAQQGR